MVRGRFAGMGACRCRCLRACGVARGLSAPRPMRGRFLGGEGSVGMRGVDAVLCAAFEPPDLVPALSRLGPPPFRPVACLSALCGAHGGKVSGQSCRTSVAAGALRHRVSGARRLLRSFGEQEERMDLVQLRRFLAVAETEHITESARRLGTTQPALSRSIRALERELGVSLFERSGRNVRLTPCGELLRRRASPLVAGIDGLGRELAAFCEGGRHVVRIDVRAASEAVTEAMEAYKRKRPDVRFELGRSADRAGCDVLVDALGADKELAGVVGWGGFEVTAFFEERIGVLVPLESGVSESASLRELTEGGVVYPAREGGFRSLCDELCARHGVAPDVVFAGGGPSLVCDMVALGQGTGFWPERSWGDPPSGDVRLVRVREGGFARRVVIASPAGCELDGEPRLFLEYLVCRLGARWVR
ncbi:hypothetical protein B5F41_13220 [Gordonibacter sp. An232A]|nr:hypothetical protein B5F41_13220 [Gordonibacter sp. An232A]